MIQYYSFFWFFMIDKSYNRFISTYFFSGEVEIFEKLLNKVICLLFLKFISLILKINALFKLYRDK